MVGQIETVSFAVGPPATPLPPVPSSPPPLAPMDTFIFGNGPDCEYHGCVSYTTAAECEELPDVNALDGTVWVRQEVEGAYSWPRGLGLVLLGRRSHQPRPSNTQ